MFIMEVLSRSLSFCICTLAGCVLAHAQNPSISLNVNQSGLTLDYILSRPNVAYFVLSSSNIQALLSQGEVLSSGFTSNGLSGSNTFQILSSATEKFFALAEYPDALADDMGLPINDEDSTNAPSYFFDVDKLPYPLSVNVPFEVTILISDGDRNLQPVNGRLELTLLDGTKQVPSFPFTITPSSIPVTKGVGSGTITIQAVASLSTCVLATTFYPTATLGLKGSAIALS
jgi:hypothetical protein